MNKFKDVIGYEDIIQYIKNAISEDQVSHAYILNGERGSGKKMLANLFARTLLCNNNQLEPCNACQSCIQAESSNNPDIITVQHEKIGSIGIDDIRSQVNNDILLKPYANKYKVYIIPEADKMTEQAQNALLKTIEEPPTYAVILLLTENPDQLLSTIKSRCVMLKLRNIRNTLVKQYLVQQKHIPEYQAQICATFAQGNIGRALELATSEYFNEIKDSALTLLRQINDLDTSDVIATIKGINQYKIDILDYLDIMIIWYRDILIYKATKNKDKVIFEDQLRVIEERATRSSYEGLETILQAIDKSKARIRANVNFDLVIELLLLTIKEN